MYDNLPMNEHVSQTYGNDDVSYFVFVEGGRSPTKRHPNRFLAEKEARRIAAKIAGSTVHVLKARSTYVNGMATEVRPRAERMTDVFNTQMEARAGMEPGKWVKTRPDHHAYPDQIGYIDRLGDEHEGDSSVYVRLAMTYTTVRFSPTSLFLQSAAVHETIAAGGKAEEAESAPTARVGDIITRNGSQSDYEVVGVARRDDQVLYYRCRNILTNERYDIAPGDFTIKMTAEQRGIESAKREAEELAREEPKGMGALATAVLGSIARMMVSRLAEDKAGEIEDVEAAPMWEKARAIPAGTDIYVIHSAGLIGTAHPAHKLRNDDDKRFIWAGMVDEHGVTIEEMKVNGSRVFRADDPEMVVLK